MLVFHGFGGRLAVMDVGPTTMNQIMNYCFKEIHLRRRDLNGKNQFGQQKQLVIEWLFDLSALYDTIRYDTIGEFNVDSKAEYSALSSTRSQKKKLKQRQCPFNTVQVKNL